MAALSNKKIDKPFLISVLVLAVLGFLIFLSASLGVLTRDQNIFMKIALNQVILGLGLGLLSMFLVSKISYKFWKKYSFVFFILAVILTAAVFIPGIGWTHGGATRWIAIGNFTFQPSEILKIGYLMYLATFLSRNKKESQGNKTGIIPFFILTSTVGSILVFQPDNDTFFMTAFAGLSMFFISGARAKDILIIFLIAIIGILAIFYTRPYIRDRVMTFLHPGEKSLSSGYQIQQSLIAIGSGGLLGKGFGQSTQKFGFLPEPIGDSIFAVAGEEFGFVGSVALLACFLFFTLRGLKIASNTEDSFGRLLTVGIVILIISGSFINIASMLSIMPLSGTPLNFVSHGGTALFLTLAEVGIILNISKEHQLKRKVRVN